MKKNTMQEINKAEKEFDQFVNNEHTEFICNLIGGVLAISSAIVIIIGQYSKHVREDDEE